MYRQQNLIPANPGKYQCIIWWFNLENEGEVDVKEEVIDNEYDKKLSQYLEHLDPLIQNIKQSFHTHSCHVSNFIARMLIDKFFTRNMHIKDAQFVSELLHQYYEWNK